MAVKNGKRPAVLLVDDDPGLLKLASMRLKAADYDVECATSADEALSLLRQRSFHVVLTDLRMDGKDGMQLFHEVRKLAPSLPVIIMTAHGSIPEAVKATQQGVFSFLTKPLDKDELLSVLDKAVSVSGEIGGDGDESSEGWRAHIITRNEQFNEVLSQAKLVARSEVNVLILGESGTGKELMAQAIHAASNRSKGEFIPINCGALPEHLLESELFGHVKGAFTGASSDHKGLFLAADGGTIFLDEIGDMPQPLQVKLLRVLQERQVRPVGSTKTYPINVRVISATHRNLEKAMKEGDFREDLYYRLNVVQLRMPPLGERSDDIPMLVAHFLGKIAKEQDTEAKNYSPEAMQLLVAASWPGNVRQLYNVVEQTVALSTGRIIPASLVQRALQHESSELPSLTDARNEFERDYIIKLLRMVEGNVSQAARLAKRNRTDFYKLLSRHDIDVAEFKAS